MVGITQGDAIRNMRGVIRNGASDGFGLFIWATGAFRRGSPADLTYPETSKYTSADRFYSAEFDASLVVPTSTENRPKNASLAPRIYR